MNRLSNKQRSRAGQAMVEFTFVGIPLMFALISIFEISRGMWIYHTLAYSVKNGIRYAAVHGINCINGPNNPNNCPVNIGPAGTAGTIANVISVAAVGLDPARTTLTFTDSSGTASTCALNACTAIAWPPNVTGVNDVGQSIQIDIRTPFVSAIGMFWPGATPLGFASGTLGASSQDYIQF
jgi:Flp pilus assembly protein TadG